MKLIVLYELLYLHVCLILYLNKTELNWIEKTFGTHKALI